MESEASGAPTSGAALARKLNLLLNTAEAEGRKICFSDVSKAMSAAGTPLSRSRWHYMRSGTGPTVKKIDLLKNLAVFFGVSEGYLLDGDEELPARVEAQLDLLATMKANKIRKFAARQLEGLDTETLLQIRGLIDQHLDSEDTRRPENR
jgi:transcriptional regulator with XRE-family HTH domain